MIYTGDCLEELKKLPDSSVDAIVTDPPYELGFMGKSWDNTGIANNVDMWKECLRVLKPGGHLLSFGGTRTYHRMACAIEDAGFEIRDMIEWVYGSGFPKSLNIGKAVDKLQGNEREFIGNQGKMNGRNIKNHKKEHEILGGVNGWDKDITKGTSEWEGWGTALKPAHEPICMARKPLQEKTVAENCLKWGTGGINIDESRVGTEQMGGGTMPDLRDVGAMSKEAIGIDKLSCGQNPRPALRKEQPTYTGRFPANLIHDNSEEVRECFPESKSNGEYKKEGDWENTGDGKIRTWDIGYDKLNKYAGQEGNASRFFKSIIYQAKASKSERNKGCEGLEEKPKVFNGQSDKPSTDMKDVEKRFTTLPKANNHPTVKPIALMEYLINMVTREGQTVLDPFAGSGTTLIAAKKLGRKYIGIELEPEYVKIAEARLISIKKRLL